MACYNGSSEMVTQLANAIITFLFNIVMMKLAGGPGVAAITILLYGQFLFNAFYLGFTIGISPLVGFQYGAKNHRELKNIYQIAFVFTAISSVILTIAAVVSAGPLVQIFTTRKPLRWQTQAFHCLRSISCSAGSISLPPAFSQHSLMEKSLRSFPSAGHWYSSPFP